MKTILQINSSLFNGSGQSSRLAGDLVARIRKQHPDAEVIVRDLVKNPVPHLDAERFQSLAGKKAYVLATRGGLYAGTGADTQTGYVRQFLAFLGIEAVEFIYAEGLAIGAEKREASLRAAQQRIERIAA